MGKIVGGSHRLNNMLHVQPHKRDFEELFGDNGERDILEYFRRAEKMFAPGK